jgi:MFS family permease
MSRAGPVRDASSVEATPHGMGDRDVGRLVRTLALPTFGLALAMSVLTTYAPVLLGEKTDSGAAIGLAIGGEGLFALFLPVLVGSLSDRTRSRLGRRLPYAVFAAPVLVVPLALVPFSDSYAATVALVSLFFVGYFVYYPPYQALFADLVPATHRGRAVGVQGVMRGLGLGAALVGGGLLLSAWAPLPFLLGGAAVVLTTIALVRGVPRSATTTHPVAPTRGPGIRALLRERADIRAFVAANALWEFSFMGLKTFIVLYVVKGLGESVATASAVIGVVAASYVVAAAVSGRLADRIGLVRLLRGAAWVYGAGLLFAATLDSTRTMLVGLPVVALAGAVLMTLPYGLLMQLTPAGAEGAVSGLFNVSRAVGVLAGPIVVGAVIDVAGPLFSSTHGYGAMWVAVGVPIVLSLAFLPALSREEARAEPVRETAYAPLDELAVSA